MSWEREGFRTRGVTNWDQEVPLHYSSRTKNLSIIVVRTSLGP